MEELLQSTIDQYQNLSVLKRNLDTELESTARQMCLYFIHIHVSQTSNHSLSTTTDLVCNRYTKRFVRNDDYFKYSYGDIINDKKYNMKCVALNETHKYVTLWYYEYESEIDRDEVLIRKRIKTDSNLEIITPSVLY